MSAANRVVTGLTVAIMAGCLGFHLGWTTEKTFQHDLRKSYVASAESLAFACGRHMEIFRHMPPSAKPSDGCVELEKRVLEWRAK
jgi:hypothetical protein